MSATDIDVVVIGAGVFGTTAAAELRRRGHEVLIVSPGLEPDPQASSTDVSKILRMEYGPDEVYARLMVAAFEGWRELRRRWQRIDGEPIIHWPGFLLLRGEAPGPEDWESQSLEVAATLGLPHRRLDGESLARQFPAWAGAGWPFATFQPMAGYGESARIVSRLLREALVAGVKHVDDRVVELEPGEPVCCMRLASGRRIEGDIVVLAAGAWTPTLVPELVEDLQPVAQPVFRLRPSDPERFTAERFPVFAADITRTGFYGFPLDRDGLVKIANHGPGLAVPAGQSAGPGAEEEARLREFLRRRLPELAALLPLRLEPTPADRRLLEAWQARLARARLQMIARAQLLFAAEDPDQDQKADFAELAELVKAGLLPKALSRGVVDGWRYEVRPARAAPRRRAGLVPGPRLPPLGC